MHGKTCFGDFKTRLPESDLFELAGWRFGLTHGSARGSVGIIRLGEALSADIIRF